MLAARGRRLTRSKRARGALRSLLVLLCSAWSSACTVHVFSPVNLPPLESSATLGEGRYSVQGEAYVGGAIWGPKISSYRAVVARGITPKLDVSLAPSLLLIHAREPGNPRGNVYSLRAGVKYAPERWLAFSAGLAPGSSVGGSYLAEDFGFTMGGENRYLVPFFSARGVLSVPLRARTVRIMYDDWDDSPEEESQAYFRKPLFTSGWQIVQGLKLPLTHDAAAKVRPSLVCAVSFTGLYTRRASDLFGMFGCAAEATF